MVAVLVREYKQPLSEAWRCTLREFLMVTEPDSLRKDGGKAHIKPTYLEGLKAHLRSLGKDV